MPVVTLKAVLLRSIYRRLLILYLDQARRFYLDKATSTLSNGLNTIAFNINFNTVLVKERLLYSG